MFLPLSWSSALWANDVVLNFRFSTCQNKKRHPAFNRAIDGGLTFGNLTVSPIFG
jgi:hypothetical protein